MVFKNGAQSYQNRGFIIDNQDARLNAAPPLARQLSFGRELPWGEGSFPSGRPKESSSIAPDLQHIGEIFGLLALAPDLVCYVHADPQFFLLHA